VTASLIEHQRPERARPLVVIVDQDRMSAMILARALERGGYLVECVASAVAGLDLLGQRDAVAVICEAVLQDLPASAFIVRARQIYAPKPLPVFVITADARPAQRLALLRAGIVDCLSKPVEAEELRLRIERALGTTVEPLATPVHLSGDLVHFPLPDVLAMLELAHYTGQIDVAGARGSGSIELVNGRPRHASYGRHVGAAAFRAILRQARGWFRVHPGQPSTASTLCGSTTQLVLEASVADLEWEKGSFHVKGDPSASVTIADIAMRAHGAGDLPEGIEGGLDAQICYNPENLTYPYGAYFCVVDIDPGTAVVKVRRFLAVDDCGTRINPMIIEGQIHGGITDGIGMALMEIIAFDEEGNCLGGSLMDYLIPTALEVPHFETGYTVTPSPHHPIGAKGVGESATVGSPPAVVNAVVDALAPFGVRHADMPLTPSRVWEAMQGRAAPPI